jgi:hypothetical protein
MDVQPETVREELLRDQDAIAGYDDDAGLAGKCGETIGLLDRDIEPLRALLRGWRGPLASAPLRLVRPGEEQLDVVSAAR